MSPFPVFRNTYSTSRHVTRQSVVVVALSGVIAYEITAVRGFYNVMTGYFNWNSGFRTKAVRNNGQ